MLQPEKLRHITRKWQKRLLQRQVIAADQLLKGFRKGFEPCHANAYQVAICVKIRLATVTVRAERETVKRHLRFAGCRNGGGGINGFADAGGDIDITPFASIV